MGSQGRGYGGGGSGDEESWRLRLPERFRVPERFHRREPFYASIFGGCLGKQSKIAEYYREQENLIEDFSEMETLNEFGCLYQNAPSEEELRWQLAKSERLAINVSNVVNLSLFVAKLFASIQSVSMVIIAATLDSLLGLLSGFLLWITAHAMKNPNKYSYPIGKRRIQPVGMLVFASVTGTLGFRILINSGRQLITQEHENFNHKQELWMVGSMSLVAAVKFFLMLYCRSFKNEIVRAYTEDHFFDVITNSIGLASALFAVRCKWWMDPVGAILIALKTVASWSKNVGTLIGKSAPAKFLTKLTFLTWNHHEEIRHIEAVRAYAVGTHYFVEVDITLPADMPLSQSHDIGESLQEKLEQLSEVERAFVRIDLEFTHRPECRNPR